jgi:predicted homoserine dehydrogenase-like protein
MNLMRLLAQRIDAKRPVRAGQIEAGKFVSIFLAQIPSTPGLKIADMSPDWAQSVEQVDVKQEPTST